MKNEHEDELCHEGEGECPVCGQGEQCIGSLFPIPGLADEEAPYLALAVVGSGGLRAKRVMDEKRMKELDIECEEDEFAAEIIQVDHAEFIEVAERYGHPRHTIKGMLELADMVRAEGAKKKDD